MRDTFQYSLQLEVGAGSPVHKKEILKHFVINFSVYNL